jgi:dCTP deaminase
MIVNGSDLLAAAPIKNMLASKERLHGVSHGLAEAGYDIRLKQDIIFRPMLYPSGTKMAVFVDGQFVENGRFTIASAIEEFDMPEDLVGVVHDKSTWARRGLSVFNTVLEPGWKGFLTLELVYHGSKELHLPAGAGIAQVLFSEVSLSASYGGKYQHQANRPVEAIYEKG